MEHRTLRLLMVGVTCAGLLGYAAYLEITQPGYFTASRVDADGCSDHLQFGFGATVGAMWFTVINGTDFTHGPYRVADLTYEIHQGDPGLPAVTYSGRLASPGPHGLNATVHYVDRVAPEGELNVGDEIHFTTTDPGGWGLRIRDATGRNIGGTWSCEPR
ncbi:MAG TPA: hypothetical protein VNZ52_04340 [Candidatus Thermoplasmatota archaeon]|nr:hypothetical protein [Candidatus Thermoplasmatota archaeon]